VAALSADTAIKGAGLNVLINLSGIDDQEFNGAMRKNVAELKQAGRKIVRRIMNRVDKKIADMN
jgi:formiminotetrahydrofolate cyclodeaminase